MLLFYTGAELDKPTYRRGILDTLSYPSGHALEYSYRRQNIDPRLVDTDLKGRRAAIVFVDVDDQNHATYMPVRLAQVVKHSPLAGAAPRERIGFTLSLGGFVTYPDDAPNPQNTWHDDLLPLDVSRKVNGHFRYFVIDSNFAPGGAATAKAWEDAVAAVARSSKLRGAIFVKLDLKNLDNPNPPKLRSVGERQVYQLRPGKVYGLDLCVYQNPPAGGDAAREAKIALTRSSELLEVGQAFQSAVSGLAQQTALVSCKRSIEKNLVALGVTIDEPVANVVNTPHPFFLLRISLPWVVPTLIVVSAFLGSFFVALDADTIKEILPKLANQSGFISVVAKWLGGAFLAFTAYLGFRKLPSGQ